MIPNTFNDKTEFYMTDALDPLKLYHAARHVESQRFLPVAVVQ